MNLRIFPHWSVLVLLSLKITIVEKLFVCTFLHYCTICLYIVHVCTNYLFVYTYTVRSEFFRIGLYVLLSLKITIVEKLFVCDAI